MRTQKYLLATTMVLMLAVGCGIATAEEKSTTNDGAGKTYIGVIFDPSPLPQLLAKHLHIAQGQGLIITNIFTDSPADKAGLDKDDIVIELNGKPTGDPAAFSEEIQKTPAGKSVDLQIIRMGEKKAVKVAPEQMKEQFMDRDQSNWKYPLEADNFQVWQPGSLFRMKPGEDQWSIEPFEDMPDAKTIIGNFVREKYVFSHSDNNENFFVIIDGAPADKSTKITVQSGQKEYTTTADDIDALPEKYRKTVQNDIDTAKTSVRIKSGDSDRGMIKDFRRFFFRPDRNFPDRVQNRKDDTKKLESLEKRIEHLEKTLEKK